MKGLRKYEPCQPRSRQRSGAPTTAERSRARWDAWCARVAKAIPIQLAEIDSDARKLVRKARRGAR